MTKEATPDQTIDVVGTSLRGEVDIHYDHIVATFGEPNALNWDRRKVDIEWWLRTNAGVATLYNLIPDTPNDTQWWHIGAATVEGAHLVAAALNTTLYQVQHDPKVFGRIYHVPLAS